MLGFPNPEGKRACSIDFPLLPHHHAPCWDGEPSQGDPGFIQRQTGKSSQDGRAFDVGPASKGMESTIRF